MDQNRTKGEVSIKKAALINAAAKYSNVLFMLIANAVLARLLSPEEYGVLAITSVFIAFFSVLSDMGLGAGVIQDKSLTDEEINHIFSFSAYLSLLLCVAFWGVAYLTAILYENQVYIGIGMLLSISVLFNTLNMIPNAKLMRDKKFVLLAIRSVSVSVGSYLVAIVLAFQGFSYYSLVVQSIASSIFLFIWNYASTRLKFSFKFDLRSVQKIFSYSAFNFLYDILNYLARNLDNILTGRFMGHQALGYYNKAYQLMLYPVQYLTNVITPVMHPILSDYQHEKEIIYEKSIGVLKCLSLLGIPATAVCVFEAREIVLILYGGQWLSAVPCVAILGATVWFQMLTSTYTSIFKSLGETKQRFRSGIVYVVLQIMMIGIGVSTHDIVKLSVFVAVSFVLRYLVECYYLIRKAFGMPLLRFYGLFVPEVIMMMMISVVMVLTNRYFVSESVFISFVVKGFVCGITFVIGVLVTGQYKYAVGLIPRKLRAKWNLT